MAEIISGKGEATEFEWLYLSDWANREKRGV